MRRRTLEELAGLMGGKLDGQVATDEVASGASIDTRTLRSGDLFFALPGTRTHGKQHAGAALSRGAAAVVVDEQLPTTGPRPMTSRGRKRARMPWSPWQSPRLPVLHPIRMPPGTRLREKRNASAERGRPVLR